MPSLKPDSAASRLTLCALLSAICLVGVGSAFGQISTSTTASLAPTPVDLGTTPVATVTVTASDGSTPDSLATCTIQTRGHAASYSVTLQGGVASISLPSVAQDPVGNYTLACSYGGSSNYAPSSATTISFSIISPISTTTTVSVAPSSVTYGSSPVATVTVTASDGSTPTGSVSCNIQTRGHAAAYSSGLTNGSASIPLTSIAQDPVGTYSFVCSYGGYSSYTASSSSTISLNVTQAVPVITWPSPAAITYPTPLSATQLNATANVAGTFTYSPVAGTVEGAGTQTLTVTFQPSDTTDYMSTTTTTTIVVGKGTPTLTWGAPASISTTTALSATQLDATANIAGTFTYSPAAGTVLPAGNNTLSVTFTPTDTTDYVAVTGSVTLAVYTATTSPTTISLATSATPVNHGSPVTFTATLSDGPTGNVAFHDGSIFIGNGTISSNTATLTTNTLSAGTHTITASWQGDANYSSATSNPVSQVINGISVSGSPGITTTVAGTGVLGYTGDGGPATSAELEGAQAGIGVDGANNVYFCDGPSRVRKIAAATGIISTVAGNGSAGSSGDGGPAPSAQLSCNAIAVDAAGDIFIGDVNDNRIRMISATTGIITTVAGNGTPGNTGDGGLATSATIDLSSTPSAEVAGTSPVEVAVDAAGDIYFYNSYTVSGNDAVYDIRVVNASTGIISTLPNTQGDASTGRQIYFAVDPSGNVYLLNQYGGYIFKISSAAGHSSTVVAGRGIPGDTGDGGSALSAEVAPETGTTDSSGNLYFTQDNVVRELNVTTGNISVVAWDGGSGEGCLQQTDSIGDGCLSIDTTYNNYVGALAVDSNGNIYGAGYTVGAYNVINGNTYIRSTAPLLPTAIQPSTTSLSCGSTMTYGTDLTCSTTVTAGATGTVSLAYPSISPTIPAYAPEVPLVSGAASDVLPTAALPVGTYSIVATYNGDSTYVPSITTNTVVVTKATPTITWSTPAAITYGTPLSAQQLNASSSVPGVLTYTPGLTAVLPVGSNTIEVSFAPTDSTDYTGPVTKSQTLLVTGATPAISWPTPAPLQYGTALSSSQLNATANVPGTFAYSPASGAILPVGSNTLSVTFTPTASSNNTSNAPVTASVQIVVNPDAPNIASILPNPVAVGATVTISGQNFGPAQGSNTVIFNGVTATVTQWTDNQIVTTVPGGASTGNVIVNVSGIPSNSFLIMIPTSCTVTP
jgi:hypothetical protein